MRSVTLSLRFQKTEGYAIWNKSVVQETKNPTVLGRDGEGSLTQTLVFTPVVLEDSNLVTSFFYSKIVGDSVELHLYRANDYDHFQYGNMNADTLTAERLALKLMELNYVVFGHEEFKLTDSLLFRQNYHSVTEPEIERTIAVNPGNSFAPGPASNSLFTVSTVEICTIFNCPPSNSFAAGTTANFIKFCGSCEIVIVTGGTYEWPPELPSGGTGGMGGGSGTPPPNCSGGTNCRSGSLIEEGRLPCGGCGNGPIVVVPADDPPPMPTEDTCEIANAIALKMDTLYTKGKVDSMLGTMPGWQALTYEKGFSIYKNYTLNAGIATVTGYQPGVVQGSSASMNVDITFDTSGNKKAAGAVHIHTDSGYACPSAGDIYSLIQNYITFNNSNIKLRYEGSMVAAFDTTFYAISISNPADALMFNTTKSANLNTLTAAWKDSTALYSVWDAANTYFYDKDSTLPERARDDNAILKAHATVLTQFKSGITLFKRNSFGKFKPIVIDTKPDPTKPGKYIFTEKCL